MFKPLHIRVNSLPIAQPRQRHSVVAGHVRNYTPAGHAVNAFKAAIQLAASQEYNGPTLDCDLKVKIVAVFPRPKNMIWKSKEMPRASKSSKPDIDNVVKSIFDALNKVLWRDDSLVCQLVAEKYIASGNEQPHVFIVVEEAQL